jgi:hypothetical protein
MPFIMIHGGNMSDTIFCIAIIVALYIHLISDSVVIV